MSSETRDRSERIKQLWRDLQDAPWFAAILEVSLSVLATLVPFLVVSIPVIAAQDGKDSVDFLTSFGSYFQSGELVLPTFAVFGAIASILVLNTARFGRFLAFSVISLILFAVLFLGNVIGETSGFEEEIRLYPDLAKP